MANILIESAIDERLSEVWGVEPYLAYQGLFAGQTDLIGIHDGKIQYVTIKILTNLKRKNGSMILIEYNLQHMPLLSKTCLESIYLVV